MEKPAFTKANLFNVRVVMTIMHVLMEEFLCQAMTGHIPVPECLLSGVRGRLWLHPVMLGIKWHCFLRPRLQGHLPDIGEPSGVATDGPDVC
jgi:hypothetical protein